MNILLLGSGGREHALAWKIAQSPLCDRLFIAPGNGGTILCGTNLEISVRDFDAVANAVVQHNISMVVVGPEDPLVHGIVDYFRDHPDFGQLPVIGPSAEGAMLEGSKDFAKRFMERHGIPTARHLTVTLSNADEGAAFIDSLPPPYVLKADGLAAGKGVVIMPSPEEARAELKDMLGGKFGEASTSVVIEEFLDGIELSVFALTDGKSYKVLPSAKDYKRVGENDTGPNTGGMGAVSPVPFADAGFMQKVEDRIIAPTVRGLARDGIEYRGFLFVGLMKVGDDPFVIEYNCRMGDPETEVVLPRLGNDMVALFNAVHKGTLSRESVITDERTAATVVLVSSGYPGPYENGKPVEGLDRTGDCLVFQAGTRLEDGIRYTSGGRVMAITGMANTLKDALQQAYGAIEKIGYANKSFRRDIGRDLMESAARVK